jgi:hypothetical protein
MALDPLQRSEQAALKNLDLAQSQLLCKMNFFCSSVPTRMDMVVYQSVLQS